MTQNAVRNWITSRLGGWADDPPLSFPRAGTEDDDFDVEEDIADDDDESYDDDDEQDEGL